MMVWWRLRRVQQMRWAPGEFWSRLEKIGSSAARIPSLHRAQVSLEPGSDTHLAFSDRPTVLLTFRVMEVHPEREMLWTTRVWNNRLNIHVDFCLRPLKGASDPSADQRSSLTLTISASGPLRFFARPWLRQLETNLWALVGDLDAVDAVDGDAATVKRVGSREV